MRLLCHVSGTYAAVPYQDVVLKRVVNVSGVTGNVTSYTILVVLTRQFQNDGIEVAHSEHLTRELFQKLVTKLGEMERLGTPSVDLNELIKQLR